MKFTWKSIFPGCYKGDEYTSPKPATVVATKTGSFNRISMSDLSFPSATAINEDLSISLAGSNLHVFTLAELKIITQGFSSSNFLGEGGFGPVHKGFIDDKLRPGLMAQPVAVKLLDLDGSQGHKEWLTEVVFLGQLTHSHLVKLIGYCCEEEHRLLVYEYLPRGSLENQLFRRYSASLPWSTRMKIAVGAAKGLAFLHEAKKPVIYRDFKASNILLDSDYNAKLSDFGLAKDGPEGDDTHVSTRVMGTQGYAAPEYIMTGHLTAMSDVYSFGVVLLEMLTGRRSVDKARPPREQNLVEWARPVLNDSRKLCRIMDPRLEGQYSEMGAKKAAALAYQCLSHRPRNRPTMTTVVKALEPLQDFDDIPIGPFVYTVPAENNEVQQKDAKEGESTPRERKKENGGYHRNSNLSNGRRHSSDGSVTTPRDARECDTPKERKRENGHRNHHRRKHPLKSPDSRSRSRNEVHQNGERRSGSGSPESATVVVAATQNEAHQNGKRSESHTPESATANVATEPNEVHQNGRRRRSGSHSPESATAIVAPTPNEAHQNGGRRSGSHSPESATAIVAATPNEAHQNGGRRSGSHSPESATIAASTRYEVHQNDRRSGSHSPESATEIVAGTRNEVHQNGRRSGSYSSESATAIVAAA